MMKPRAERSPPTRNPAQLGRRNSTNYGFCIEGVPPEEDITCRGMPPSQRPGAWSESTERLLETQSLRSAGSTSSYPSYTVDPTLRKSVSVSIRVGLRRSQSGLSNPPRESVDVTTCSRSLPSGDGIELENLPPGTAWHSTDRLIPSRPASHGPKKDLDIEIPNYKPVPLRWPFQVFLILLMGGLFAFFEYQMHRLPPEQIKLLQFSLPKPVGTTSFTSVPLTAATKAALTRRGGNAAVAAAAPNPTPEPIPIPPESLYPAPAIAITTHCSWAAPIIIHYEEADVSERRHWFGEVISVDETEEESWCPCRVTEFLEDETDDTALHLREAESDDKGCNSVMRAITSYASAHSTTWSTLHETSSSVGFYETFFNRVAAESDIPSRIRDKVAWPLASIGNDGQIMMPLEIRTGIAGAGSNYDVFGDSVQPPRYTGLFPARFPAGESPTSLVTVWWTLPLSSPVPRREVSTSTATSDGTITSVTSSESLVRTSTTTSGAQLTSSAITAPITSIPTFKSLSPENGTRTGVSSSTRRGVSSSSSSSSLVWVAVVTTITSTQGPDSSGSLTTITTTITSSSISQPPQGAFGTDTFSPHNSTNSETTISNINTTNINTAINTISTNIINSTASITTKTTKSAAPSRTPNLGPISPGAEALFFNLRSEADYLLASLIPVLLATLLSIPIQALCVNIGAMLPFRALRSGASAQDSLLLPRGDGASLTPAGLRVGIRFLNRGDALPIMGTTLDFLSAILVALSGEVIRLEFTSSCKGVEEDDGYQAGPVRVRVCAFGLRKAGIPMRLAEGLLVGMAVLVIAVGLVLLRWRSGVGAEPWSIASLASLVSRGGHEFGHAVGEPHGKKFLKDEGFRFKLGFHGGGEDRYYGIAIESQSDVGTAAQHDGKQSVPRLTTRDPPERKPPSSPKTWRKLKSVVVAEILALVLTAGQLILILYYENTMLDTAFEAFMDSESFGVRILFTSFGIAVSWFWDHYFCVVFDSELYRRIAANGPLPAPSSILLSPPTHVFAISPAWIASARTGRDVLSLGVAVATFLAKLTPILFSNIPFRNTVTWKMHRISTLMAIAILAYMVLILGASLGTNGSLSPRAISSPCRPDRIPLRRVWGTCPARL